MLTAGSRLYSSFWVPLKCPILWEVFPKIITPYSGSREIFLKLLVWLLGKEVRELNLLGIQALPLDYKGLNSPLCLWILLAGWTSAPNSPSSPGPNWRFQMPHSTTSYRWTEHLVAEIVFFQPHLQQPKSETMCSGNGRQTSIAEVGPG